MVKEKRQTGRGRRAGLSGAREKKATTDARSRAQAPSPLLDRVVPLLSLALSFALVVMLFWRVFPRADESEAPADETPAETPAVSSSNAEVQNYVGLETPWIASLFTTGNQELDTQVKEFCDALAVEGQTAQENAQIAYNTIVWSTFEERGDDEALAGSGWDVAAARQYFSTGDPEQGIGGAGDYYEFAAATSFCLRYFGYADALAVPTLSGAAGAEQGSAVCLFTDEYGFARVCDPALGAEGWMLDRDVYPVVVEDIGQDLTQVEALGLSVQVREVAVDAGEQGVPNDGQLAQEDDVQDDDAQEGEAQDDSSSYDYEYDYDSESYDLY